MNIIEISNVSKSYKNNAVLRGISLEIGENESSKTITATINSVSESNEVDNINEPEISEVIKLNEDANSQDIKSENSFGNLYSNWAMISLGVFSVVIALLLLLKKKKRKNELI